MTEFASPPQSAIWYSKLVTKHFLRFIPMTRIKTIEEQRQTAYFETRDFELLSARPRLAHDASAGNHAAHGTAATSQLAVGGSSCSVAIPATLPADPAYFRGLVREVSDSLRDVSMSSSLFMQQLKAGRLQLKEHNIERIVVSNQPMTVVGWVHRDPHTGKFSLLAGTGNTTAAQDMHATAAMLPRGVTPVMVNTDVAAVASAAGVSTALLPSSLHHQPDLCAYSYSSDDRPCIMTSKSHGRILEDERASVGYSRKLLLLTACATAVVLLAIGGRYLYRAYTQQQQMHRLLELHAMRRERREARQREKKERQRRRAAKRHQQLQLQELAQLKQAQVAYFNAAAALSAAASGAQEGMPHFGRASPLPDQRQTSSPMPPPHAQYYRSTQGHTASASSSAACSAPQFTSDLVQTADAYRHQPPHIDDGDEEDDDDASYASDASSLDDGSLRDLDSSEEDRPNNECLICADSKADACFFPCGHMYTCMQCASRLTLCPVCRERIDQVVKVFAQQL